MKNVFELLFPFIATPANYDEMLRKLAGLAFYEVYILTFFIRDIPPIGADLAAIETHGSIGVALSAVPLLKSINVTGMVIAALVAILANATKLHDRISDALGIRRRFDRKHILIALAKLVGVVPTAQQQKVIARQRDRLMREVFYRYTSSRADKPLVDRHYIEHALGAWAWFWVPIEACAYVGTAAVIAQAFGAHDLRNVLLLVFLSCVLAAFLLSLPLKRYSRAEIETIAADTTARQQVKAVFDAL